MLSIIAMFNIPIYAKSITESLGDIFAVSIPVGAYATTIYKHDEIARAQFYKSYGSTLGSTYILKYSVREKRPNSQMQDSFPSAHTASAFAGAAFIDRRYGLRYAIVPYLAAIYTGYSRVNANKHYGIDVFAGALLGIFFNYYFVSNDTNINAQAIVKDDFKGLKITYMW